MTMAMPWLSRCVRFGFVVLVSGAVVANGAVPAAAATPSAPYSVRGIGYENAVRLTWIGPDDDGGSPMTEIRIADDLGASWVLPADHDYPVVLTGLPNGVARRFTVRAVNADGVGPASAPSAPVTPHAPYVGPTWVSAATMPGAREQARSVVLGTGKVLVVGGSRFDPVTWNSVPLATAAVFDPSTGVWTRTGSLPAPRSQFALTLLPDGRVLLTGGYDAGFTPVASVYIYSPSTGTWAAATAMSRSRADHTATLLSDGTVLVAGGTTTTPAGRAATATAETFTPSTGLWRATGAMPVARTRHAAVRLTAGPAGRVFVVGGNDGSAGLRPTTLYQQATRRWSVGPSMLQMRSSDDVGDPSVTSLADGRVLVAGGYNAGVLATAEIYSPTTGAFTVTGALRFATEGGHSATLLTSGRVLVVGGVDDFGGLATTQIYTPATGKWTRGNDLPVERANHTAVRLADGSVFIAGGTRWLPTFGTVATAFRYGP
jgi:hypothetical protein